ncbi:tail fiber assembly protein [Hafnia alvei]|uniref:tail fiber assembly protein n=1 Tax=Proteus vulgaris TaxID=585 RepID=UPI00299D72F8|nr:tail fiber assembly protein [Proteus vulgaris]WOO49941.1 tail fiber assembly protein [Hafnia alvei]WPF04403.1 tail fiber assembly protein [Proteus vulgaris]
MKIWLSKGDLQSYVISPEPPNKDDFYEVELPDNRVDGYEFSQTSDGRITFNFTDRNNNQEYEKIRYAKLTEASIIMRPLELALMANQITDKEQRSLKAWQDYVINVNRVTDGVFPQKPE